MTSNLFNFSTQLEALKRQDLYRARRIIESPQGIYLHIDGQKVLNFCSNDYLGLANHPEIIKTLKKAADQYGLGSGSAHLICGHNVAHHKLEEELADFTGREKALLFSSGYMANLGVISAIIGKGDSVFEDRLNHASLLDGGMNCGARFHRYRHSDSESLRNMLLHDPPDKQLIVSDGVFSMDGDLAPINDLTKIADLYKAILMVDDAHGMGVLGKKGGGLAEELKVSQIELPVLVGTFGKAFGTSGAFVAGSESLIEMLIQKARTYIYTTALPPAIAEATRTSLKLVINEYWRREKLKQLSKRFIEGSKQLGLNIQASPSAIHALIIGSNQKTVAASAALLDKGLLVSAIRPPTIPRGSARLRITFSAMHEDQHVDRLLDALVKVVL